MEATSGWPVIPSTLKAEPALELGELMQGLIVKFAVGMANSQHLWVPVPLFDYSSREKCFPQAKLQLQPVLASYPFTEYL